MKIGLGISAGIVIAVVALTLLAVSKPADKPTRTTSPEALQLATLPPSLPPLYSPAKPTADAGDIYETLIKYYVKNRRALEKREASELHRRKVAALLTQAMNAGQVPYGFLDRYVPESLGEERRDAGALADIPRAALLEADTLYEAKRPQEAAKVAKAVFAFGHRAFKDNVRLANRQFGLSIMESGGSALFDYASEGARDIEHVQTWANAIRGVQRQWLPKQEIIASVRPHIGDLLNIAQHDEDRTFRVAGTYALAMVRYNPGHKGNQRAIVAAAARAAEDSDPAVAAAGKYVRDLTKEDLHRIK